MRLKKLGWILLIAAPACWQPADAQTNTQLHVPTQARPFPLAMASDFAVSITGTTARVNGGRVRMGSQTYAIVDSTFIFSSGTGDARIFVSQAGNLICQVTTGIVATATGAGVVAVVPTPTYPPNGIPLADLQVTNGTPVLEIDDRALLSSRGVVAGIGMAVSEAAGVASIAVDTATVPLLAQANSWIGNNDFSAATRTWPSRHVSADPATCTLGESIFNTTERRRKDCTNTNVWSAASGTLSAFLETDYEGFYPRLSQTYADPAWIGSLAWSKIVGAPGPGIGDPGSNGLMARTAPGTVSARALTAGTGVQVANGDGVAGNPVVSINSAIVATQAGNNTWTGVTDARGATQTFPTRHVAADPATCTVGEAIFNTAAGQRKDCTAANTWTVSGGGGGAVSSVFGRTGAVAAAEADYQSFYPRLSQTYANPTWISSLPWSKITGAPAAGLADPGANGFVSRTALNTSASRQIVGGSGVVVGNGDGVAGNPTVAIDDATVARYQVGTTLPSATSFGRWFFKTDNALGNKACYSTGSGFECISGGGAASVTKVTQEINLPVGSITATSTMALNSGWALPTAAGSFPTISNTGVGSAAAPMRVVTLDFAAGSLQSASTSIRLPENWDGGDISFVTTGFLASGTPTGSGLTLQVQVACLVEGTTAANNPTFSVAATQTVPTSSPAVTALATNLVLPAATLASANCTPGRMMYLLFQRDGTTAGTYSLAYRLMRASARVKVNLE